MTDNTFKPKVPDNMPSGFYFKVYRTVDKYGWSEMVVSLRRRRWWWFDKNYGDSEVTDAKYYSDPARIKQAIESDMRYLMNEARKELFNESYFYGRHP